MTNDEIEKINKLKPSFLFTVCFVALIQLIVTFILGATAWNGGYYRGAHQTFMYIYNMTVHKHIEQDNLNVDPVKTFGAKMPKGWHAIDGLDQ